MKKINLLLVILGFMCLVSALVMLGLSLWRDRMTPPVILLIVLESLLGVLLLAIRGVITYFNQREQNASHAAISQDMLVRPNRDDESESLNRSL